MFVKYFRDERQECQDLFKMLEKLTGEYPSLAIKTFETKNGDCSVFDKDYDVNVIPTLKFFSEKSGLVQRIEHFPTREEIISIISD